MPEPLKYLFSDDIINSFAKDFKLEYSKFDSKAFIKEVLDGKWSQLELKDRMHHVADTLNLFLPKDFRKSIDILLTIAKKYTGLPHMCFPDYVERFGLEDFETSMTALEHLTENSSSEFAIRPFIIRYPKQTMNCIKKWSKSKNRHVRRLASEGCRPRLPWAMALPEFKKDPQQVLDVILPMIEDESLYVRRSVANNLNDISKDHPNILIEIAGKYLGRSENTNWAIKHACRGLLKKGQRDVLLLFGYADAQHVLIKNFRVDEQVSLGDKLNFEFELFTELDSLGKLRVEFIVDFMKANGKLAGKIFHISEGFHAQSKKSISKYFSFKAISTRKYYLGEHKISIVINGVSRATKGFRLVD